MRRDESSVLLKRVFSDVIQGYNTAVYNNSTIYIRHLSVRDQAEIDSRYFDFFRSGQTRGLKTEESQLLLLKEQNLWTEADETEISNIEAFLRGLRDTKKTIYLEEQMRDIGKQITENEERLKKKSAERRDLLGLTAEEYAVKRINEFYIYKSLFKQLDFKQPIYTEEEYGELDSEELYVLIDLYNDTLVNVNINALKKIALSHFFQDLFALCNDDLFQFFAKPVVDLTILQSQLLSYGRYFKNVLAQEQQIPPELLTEPDKLIDWMTGRKNAEKIISASSSTTSAEGGGMSLVGATAKDYEALGIKGAISIEDAAKGKSGLDMNDFMKLSGLPTN